MLEYYTLIILFWFLGSYYDNLYPKCLYFFSGVCSKLGFTYLSLGTHGSILDFRVRQDSVHQLHGLQLTFASFLCSMDTGFDHCELQIGSPVLLPGCRV